jgi:hypothetical protein
MSDPIDQERREAPTDDPRPTSELPDEPLEGQIVMGEPPLFLHPQWTVGVVLILAVVTLFLGIVGHPVWLLIGSPFILTLAVWLWVRVIGRRRGTSTQRL